MNCLDVRVCGHACTKYERRQVECRKKGGRSGCAALSGKESGAGGTALEQDGLDEVSGKLECAGTEAGVGKEAVSFELGP